MDCMCRVPIVDTSSGFPLISNVGSAHHTQKLIRDNECWMVIGWCKKLTRGQHSDQSHGLLYKWVFHTKNAIIWPCLGSSNPSVATSLGRFLNINMAFEAS